MIDKSLNMTDDLEQCKEEAGFFMEQKDEIILVSERPQRKHQFFSQVEMSQRHGKNYILDRFMSDTLISSPAHRPHYGVIRSMQHFFLKVSLRLSIFI